VIEPRLKRVTQQTTAGSPPFADGTSTARATAVAKIRARVDGTQLAAAQLG
jgi:5-methyltetrahydropteroyltriglutamate--homocysteine methyltransferase